MTAAGTISAHLPPDLLDRLRAERLLVVDLLVNLGDRLRVAVGEQHHNLLDGERPGDVFNRTATWNDILLPHGWQPTGEGVDGATHWTRPGKDAGTSATTGYGDGDVLYVFNSNAPPFEPGGPYDKFAAFALLEHGGDSLPPPGPWPPGSGPVCGRSTGPPNRSACPSSDRSAPRGSRDDGGGLRG
jgi:hypothetical protein